MLLGERIKRNYENPAQHKLTCRTPVIVRVDGRAFRTFTCDNFTMSPSAKFHDAMVLAAEVVADGIQGFKLGYVQSDEASFLMTDYDNLQTQPWFGYNKSKIESVSASIMTAAFARYMRLIGVHALATFDARAFNIPEDEVANYFLWRSQNMLASARHDWGRDLIDGEKYGSFLLRSGDLLPVAPPNFPIIEELWQQAKIS
jgi:tRNA(His) guanylyltransferase